MMKRARHAETFLRIDPANGSITEVDGSLSGDAAKFSAAAVAPTGDVFCVPLDAEYVWRLRTAASTASTPTRARASRDRDPIPYSALKKNVAF